MVFAVYHATVSVLTGAAIAALVAGIIAVVVFDIELIRSRRAHGADRVAQARSYAAMYAAHVRVMAEGFALAQNRARQAEEEQARERAAEPVSEAAVVAVPALVAAGVPAARDGESQRDANSHQVEWDSLSSAAEQLSLDEPGDGAETTVEATEEKVDQKAAEVASDQTSEDAKAAETEQRPEEGRHAAVVAEDSEKQPVAAHAEAAEEKVTDAKPAEVESSDVTIDAEATTESAADAESDTESDTAKVSAEVAEPAEVVAERADAEQRETAETAVPLLAARATTEAGKETPELWDSLRDAPTVVNMMAWEVRARLAADEERDAEQASESKQGKGDEEASATA
ncbi:hypothetical protein GCM10023317_42530 [Actinopolymorpha pittospori]